MGDSTTETCPALPGAARMLYRSFEHPDDPAMSDGELTTVLRRIRDEIGGDARELLDEVLE